jgi:hypothetical protein
MCILHDPALQHCLNFCLKTPVADNSTLICAVANQAQCIRIHMISEQRLIRRLPVNIRQSQLLINSLHHAGYTLRRSWRDEQSSQPGTYIPQPLTDPDVSLSTHPAPVFQSPASDPAIANAETDWAVAWQQLPTSNAHGAAVSEAS